jgi:hypothetical protein
MLLCQFTLRKTIFVSRISILSPFSLTFSAPFCKLILSLSFLKERGSLLLYLYLGLNRPALLRVWPQLPMMYKKNYMAFTYVLKIIKSTYHAQNSGVELRRENFQHKILFFSSVPFSSTFITFSFLTFSHFHLFIKVAIYLYSKLII